MQRSRAGLYFSLLALVVATTALSFSVANAGPLVRYGRPVLVVFAAVLVVMGHQWARWLLLFLSLGALLAGPLGAANGITPWYMAGLLLWTTSLVCLFALIAVFRGTRSIRENETRRSDTIPSDSA